MPFHLNSTGLGIGSIIQPGNWGRIIRTYGWNHNRAMVEAAMEHVRQAVDPNLPARLDCAFFFDDLQEALFYRGSDASRLMMVLYEVQILDEEAVQLSTDYRNTGPSGGLNLNWANDYWTGKMGPQAGPTGAIKCQETLAVTSLMIVQSM